MTSVSDTHLATRAKALNLDAIHETVHEMCKDEARPVSYTHLREPSLVTVTQFGFGKQILVKEPEVEIPSSDEIGRAHV